MQTQSSQSLEEPLFQDNTPQNSELGSSVKKGLPQRNESASKSDNQQATRWRAWLSEKDYANLLADIDFLKKLDGKSCSKKVTNVLDEKHVGLIEVHLRVKDDKKMKRGKVRKALFQFGEDNLVTFGQEKKIFEFDKENDKTDELKKKIKGLGEGGQSSDQEEESSENESADEVKESTQKYSPLEEVKETLEGEDTTTFPGMRVEEKTQDQDAKTQMEYAMFMDMQTGGSRSSTLVYEERSLSCRNSENSSRNILTIKPEGKHGEMDCEFEDMQGEALKKKPKLTCDAEKKEKGKENVPKGLKKEEEVGVATAEKKEEDLNPRDENR